MAEEAGWVAVPPAWCVSCCYAKRTDTGSIQHRATKQRQKKMFGELLHCVQLHDS
jgi:hypothetical protein